MHFCFHVISAVTWLSNYRYAFFDLSMIRYPHDLHTNRPFAAKPSCDLLFITAKLCVYKFKNAGIEKAVQKYQNSQV